MSTEEVAKGLVALCKEGKYHEAIEKYYAQDIVSHEAMDGPMSELHGIDAVWGKTKWWEENHEIHSTEAEGPYVYKDQFAVKFTMDVTFKPNGQRQKGAEIGLYTVVDGKITKEVFFPEA